MKTECVLKFACLIGILSVIVPGQLCAQADKISFEHFQTRVTPYYLLQDHYGFIWFGSQYHGLYRYDGYDFFAYRHDPDDESSLSENSVRALAEDSDGNLWIGTIDGLNKFDRATGKFKRFLHDPLRPDSPSQNYITAIFIDRAGLVWFGTQEGGLNEAVVLKSKRDGSDSLVCRHYVHDPNDSQSISHNNVKTIWERSHRDKNRLWVGTTFGLNRFDKKTKKFTRSVHNPKDSTSLSNDEVWSIHEDSDGAPWFGTHAGGLSRMSIEDTSQIKFQNFSLAINQSLKTITSDRSGNVWIGTPEHGLFRFNLQTRKITNFIPHEDDPNSLWAYDIYSVMTDKAGVLWIGRGDGIDTYDPQQKKFHNIPIKPPPKIWAIAITSFCEDRSGFTWIGTDKRGLFKWDPSSGQMTNHHHKPGDPNSLCCQYVLTVYEDKAGTLWVGTIDGLDWFDRKTEKFHHLHDDPSQPDSPDRLLSDYIYTLYEDKHGGFWISTPRGLSKMDRGTGRFTHYMNDEENQIAMAGYCIGVIAESKYGNDHTLWIGARGLFQFNTNTGKLSRYYHDPDDPNSWIDQLVYAIQEDKTGNLWVATTGGLYCLRTDKTVAHFTVKDGLPHNITCGILEDEDGMLWISTYQGLIRYDPQSQQFRRYDMREGFLKNEFNIGVYYKGRSGNLYFGQLNGFKMFHPREIKDNPYPPPVWITNFRVFDQPISFDRPIPDMKEIRLSYRQNFFTLDFVALNYTESQKNQYAYQLEGVDPDWVNCGTRRSASYTNIHPGKYLFKVKGSNNDGVWNEQGASVKIIITPPFWQTAWFRLLMVLAIAGLVYLAYRYRINRVRELERMRIQIASDLHDDIGSNLTKIAVYSELIQTTTEKNKIKESSWKIGDMSREIITTLSDVVWSIDARNDTVGDLIDRMRDFLDTAFPPGSIQIDFQTRGLDFHQKINQTLRQNIYLIFKEAVNNAAKHATASQIRISLTNGDGKFRMEIADNGIGIDASQPRSGHHGLANMKLRAARINGELQIETREGTRVILTAKAI